MDNSFPIQYKEMFEKICELAKQRDNKFIVDDVQFLFSLQQFEYSYRYSTDLKREIDNKWYYYVTSISNGLGNYQELYMNNDNNFKIICFTTI